MIPENDEQGSKTTAKDYRERLDREEMERSWNSETLDCILSECKVSPDEFYQHWIKPLLAAGVNPETAFSLIVEGRFWPN